MDKYNEYTTIKEFPLAARKAASEGMVLLKNNDNVLPVKAEETVSLFGRCQIDYYKSGTGSGGAVNVLYKVNAVDGFRNNGILLNQTLVAQYEAFVKEHPFDNGGGGWASEPWFQEEMVVTNDMCREASIKSDKAVVIIGRTAGEEQDNIATEGSFYLTKKEIDMLDNVTAAFTKVVVVLNVGNIIDMNWLTRYGDKIATVLYAWHGGMEGGNALADIVSGKVTPSGKLVGTIAYQLEDHPTHKNFGDEHTNIYEEDIYLGYRYFETFNKDVVQFPFGHGLSYTTFDIQLETSNANDTTLDVSVTVTNTGHYKGKEVVQFYIEAPQGLLGKPKYELVAFTKTKTLLPGAAETRTVSIPVNRFGSYDDSGITGHKSAYVLEAGNYVLHIGTSVRNMVATVTYDVSKLKVLEQLSESLAPVVDFNRMKPGKELLDGTYEMTYEKVRKGTIDLAQRIRDNIPSEIKHTGDKGLKLIDVKNGAHTMEEFIAQLSVTELALLTRGEGMSHPLVTPGTAAAFGGLYQNLHHYGIPAACAADGPSGIRMDSGHKATQLPIGSLLACTWNTKLMEELYVLEGKELCLNKVDTLLGPGLNIHRHPLNGRNFEYFSEDPFITGSFSKAAIVGMAKGGSSGTLKHYAANDQEKRRRDIDAVASERCLREIHLKGFEIAVKEGNARSIMTSYNPINNVQAASNYDLNTSILRNEWGFDGIVMTDWWATMNHNVTGGDASKSNAAYMIRAQNDLFMVTGNYGAIKNANEDDIESSIANGSLMVAELQRCAINICNFILRSPVIDRPIEQIKVVDVASVTSSEQDAIPVLEPVEYNTKVNKNQWLEVKVPGVYSMVVSMRSDTSAVAQSSCTISMNGDFVYNVQTGGNGNVWMKDHVMDVNLTKGYYHFDLHFGSVGLEIGTIQFVKL